MPRKLQPCGTDAAYQRHRWRDETPCVECQTAHSTDERRRTHRHGTEERFSAGCGTHGGWYRHLYAGEEPCQTCRDAHNAARRRWRVRDRRQMLRGSIPTVIGDYVETYGPLELRELVMLIQLRHDIDESSIRRAANRMMSNGRLIRGVDIVTGDDRAGTLARCPSGQFAAYTVQPDTVWVA